LNEHRRLAIAEVPDAAADQRKSSSPGKATRGAKSSRPVNRGLTWWMPPLSMSTGCVLLMTRM
jgi:hypothetical protein